MTDFIIKKLPYDPDSTAGLALVGQYLKRINLNALVDPAFPVRCGIAHSDILRSYLGLLCMGKSDFEAVEALRASPFALRALGLVQVPSSATLRQRFDAQASRWFELIDRINERLLGLHIKGQPVDFGLLANGYCPIDIDTFAMDNSHTAKEGAQARRDDPATVWYHQPARFTAAQVIELYGQHATHEPFHSEFKTDMGLERLPSGKFDTNYLVCQLACVAMNLLRLIGAHTLHGEHDSGAEAFAQHYGQLLST
jgi:hypothetical protein